MTSRPYIHVDFVITDGHTQRSRELATSVARSHAVRVTQLSRVKHGHRQCCPHRHNNKEEEARAQKERAARIRASQQGGNTLSPLLTHVSYAVNYYVDHVIPNIGTVFDIFQVKGFWDDHWKRCMSKEPYNSASLAHLQLIRDSSTDPTFRIPSTAFLQHKLRAIQKLQQSVATNLRVDDISLLAMITLGFVEARLGDCAQYDLHRKVVSKLVWDQRGVEVMSTPLAPIVSSYDLYRSIQVAFPPLPRPKVLGPLLLGTLLVEIAPSLVKDLPFGFQELARNGKLPFELVRALHRTNQILHDRNQEPPSFGSRFREVNDSLAQPKLHTHFWTACPSLLAHPTIGEDEPGISNILSLGLWLYAALEFSILPVHETVQHWVSMTRWLRHDLTEKLIRCVKTRTDDEEKCLTWLTRVTIESWRGHDQKLLPPGSALNWFRECRFVWPRDPDEGFFVFTKGSDLSKDTITSDLQS